MSNFKAKSTHPPTIPTFFGTEHDLLEEVARRARASALFRKKLRALVKRMPQDGGSPGIDDATREQALFLMNHMITFFARLKKSPDVDGRRQKQEFSNAAALTAVAEQLGISASSVSDIYYGRKTKSGK